MLAHIMYELKNPGTENSSGERHLSRHFLVVADANNTPLSEIKAFIGIDRFDAHPDDPYAYAVDINCDQGQDEHIREWACVVNYESKIQKGEKRKDQNQDKPPNERPTIVNTSSVKRTKVMDKDLDGVVVENRAGMRFDKMPELPENNQVFTLSWTQATRDLSALDWTNWINNATYLGKPAKTLRVNDLTTTETEEQGGVWYKYVAVMEHNAGDVPWNPVLVANVGAYHIDSDGDVVPNLDPKTGDHITTPQKLGGDGSLLDPTDDMVFLEYKGYHETDFNGLVADPS